MDRRRCTGALDGLRTSLPIPGESEVPTRSRAGFVTSPPLPTPKLRNRGRQPRLFQGADYLGRDFQQVDFSKLPGIDILHQQAAILDLDTVRKQPSLRRNFSCPRIP